MENSRHVVTQRDTLYTHFRAEVEQSSPRQTQHRRDQMPLTESQIKAAKPKDKPYKIADGLGLALEVRPSGAKAFVVQYYFKRQKRSQTVGMFPKVKLAAARMKVVEIRSAVDEGRDPRAQEVAPGRAAPDDARQWRVLCEAYIAKRVKEGIADATLKKMNGNIGKTYAAFEGRQIETITPPEVLALVEKIQDTGRWETAKDVRSRISQVFQYAASRGFAENDPAHLIRNAVVKHKAGTHPGLTDGKAVGKLMLAIRKYPGHVQVKAALLLSAYTFLRSTELRGAMWSEIDLEAKLWTVPQERMKKRYGRHLVPLSTQAVEVLEYLRPWTETSGRLFPMPSDRTRPISETTLNAGLRRLGYNTRTEHCHHGFRTTASTNLNELGYNRDWIEKQLAHYDRDEVRSAYNAAIYVAGRTEMMQAWGDWLDSQEAAAV